jgi:hypothetical protein
MSRYKLETSSCRQHLERKLVYTLGDFSIPQKLLCDITVKKGRSQWPSGLWFMSSAARLMSLWVRIPPGAWMFVCCECCVLSGGGLCEGVITRPEESYRMWRVVVCDQETSKKRRLKPATGLWKIQSQWVVKPRKQTKNKQLQQKKKFLKFLNFGSKVKHVT